jgi:mannose-6-phosphate isomerase-like protein (cupin superfamily)
MSENMTPDLDIKFMVDPYLNWVKAEGATIHEGAALNLLALDVKPWARFGMNGAVCHVEGRCDYLSAFLFAPDAGQLSAPVRHTYEEVFYVLAGSGETQITLSDGHEITIEWSEKKLFAVPINATARHKAGASGARFVAISDFRYLMGLYRNEKFLFGNVSPLHGRQKRAVDAGLLADPCTLAPSLDELTPVALADLSVGVDLTTLNPKSSTIARRQMQGRHLLGVDGQGFSLSFSSPNSDMHRIDWRHGMLFGSKGMQFHQHFNGGAEPARFIAVELGSMSSPMFRSRRSTYGDASVYASGAAIIPRNEERPDVKSALV